MPRTVVTVHGTTDTVVPFTRSNLGTWARLNGCEGAARETSHSGYELRQWTACAGGVLVALIELRGVGHSSYSSSVDSSVQTTPLVYEMIKGYRAAPQPGAFLAAAIGGGSAGLLLLLVASYCVWKRRCCRCVKG